MRPQMSLTIALVVVCASLTWRALAADTRVEFGPALGAKAPSFTLADQDGMKKSLAELVGEKGVVLVFFRSADWCGYCRAQLAQFGVSAKEIEKRGYKIAGISYDKAEVLKRFHERRKLAFPLLSDQGSKTINAYGLRDAQYRQGHFAYGVPHPVLLILDAKGTVKARLFEANYEKRPPVPLLLQTLDNLDKP